MSLLDILFPRRCLGCGRIGEYFCNLCRKSILYIGANEQICPVCQKPAMDGATHPRCRGRHTPDGLTVFFRYQGVIRTAIKALKYRFVTDLAESLVACLPLTSHNMIDQGNTCSGQILCPIPLHTSRLRHRGFNQSRILGQIFGHRFGIPVRNDVLAKVRPTAPQADLKYRPERVRNLKNVFTVNYPIAKISGKPTVLVFDDVYTTGTTFKEAARKLRQAGILRVWGIMLAR